MIERFDFRLNDEKINNIDLRTLIQYDKENFQYVDNGKDIMAKFKKWAEDLPLLIIDNLYTYNFLRELDNEKISIFSYLGLKFFDDIIDKIIHKYGFEPSNYIVDLLYEALIYEANKTKS